MFNLRSDRTGFFYPEPGAASVVSPARAMEIFEELAGMRHLAFGYTDDGCADRAHLMCKKMFSMNTVPEKAWAFETPKQDLVVNFPHGEQFWWFHVAPTLGVDTGTGQRFEKMAFDPSLFDGPVPIKRWGEVMKADPKNVFVMPCGKAPPQYTGDYTPYNRTGHRTDAHAERKLNDYVRLQEEQGFMPEVFPSPMRSRFMAQDVAAPDTKAANEETFIRKGGPACPKPRG